MPDSQTQMDELLNAMNSLATEAAGGESGFQPIDAVGAGPLTTDPFASEFPAGIGPKPAAERRPEDPRRVLTIEVPVIVQLAEREMPLSKILNLSNGAIIEFDKPFDAPLELMINNKCIGIGNAVKVGENFGLRVTRMGSVRSRINALGKSQTR